MFASGAKTLAATPRQRRNFLYPSTQNAAAGEGLVPAQLSGECESFLGEVQAPAKKLFERGAAPRVLFCSRNELRKATFAAARKSQNLCSDGDKQDYFGFPMPILK
ncbi:MAG: hypothetical protein FWE68_06815 [Defluviitaleaceae bacterium]|nr:hypothetical protein [Defluviitaleaceae bacterium]